MQCLDDLQHLLRRLRWFWAFRPNIFKDFLQLGETSRPSGMPSSDKICLRDRFLSLLLASVVVLLSNDIQLAGRQITVL